MNDRQNVFISEYLKHFNATRAAIDAGYSKKTAYSIGQENLKKPEIAEEIKRRIAERTMSESEILVRLADIGRGDVAELMDITPLGHTIELMETDENGNKVVKHQTKLIRKIKQKVTTYLAKSEGAEDREIVETELELYSAADALQFLAKLNGMVTEKIDHTSKGEKIVPDDRYDRSMLSLADAIRKRLSGQDDKQESDVDAAE